MAFDKKPSTWLGAGYTVASHVAGFNTNDASTNKLLTQITDANADPTTGDIRDLMLAVTDAFFSAWQAQGTSGQPTKMTVQRQTATGPNSTTILTYSFKFTVDTTLLAVSSE